VVLGAILSIFVNQSQTNAAQQEVAYAQQNVRAAMDLMLREIRAAGYNPEGGTFEAIQDATANSITIRADIDGDGTPDDDNEVITYGMNASDQLTRTTLADIDGDGTPEMVTEPIIDFVDNLEFGYVLWGGAMLDPPVIPLTLAQWRNVRAVIIRLSIRTENPAPDTRKYRVRSLESGVRIRNRGFLDIP
jgi:hypothetical protein